MYEESDQEIQARLDEIGDKLDLVFKAAIYQGVLIAIFVSSRFF